MHMGRGGFMLCRLTQSPQDTPVDAQPGPTLPLERVDGLDRDRNGPLRYAEVDARAKPTLPVGLRENMPAGGWPHRDLPVAAPEPLIDREFLSGSWS